TLWGFPYGSTTQIPSNLGVGANESEVYLVDMADAVIGEAADIMLDISTEASYVENSTVKSAFSKDETVVRAISEHDFGMRHDASVSVITAVKWAP
ncbi:MAG: phage major capsid protein, partial [Gammaproteobacteria bacterium]|nr:phage major capsid protein [Gammaproteobacteria bacterium]